MRTRDDDNELDDAFRKALGDPDIPFDSRAWAAMNQKLDDVRARREARRKRWLAALTVLLLTASGIWYRTQPDASRATENRRPGSRAERKNPPVMSDPHPTVGPVRESTEPPSAPPATQPSGKRPVRRMPVEKAGEGENENQTSADAPITRRERGLDEGAVPMSRRTTRNATPAPVVPGQPSGETGAPGRKRTQFERNARPENETADRLRPERALGRERNEKDPPTSTTRPGAQRRFPVGAPPERRPDGEPAGQREGLPDRALFLLRPVPFRLLTPAKGEYLIQLLGQQPNAEIQPLSQEIAKPRPRSLLSRLSFHLTVAPDLSTVGFARFTTPGISGGVALEYRLSGRWSVTAGSFYSSKRYEATADNYTPPRPWAYRPDLIGGNCKVIDLPVNLRYYALSKTTGNAFVGAGLSSYLMRRENYEYRYNHYPTRTWQAPDRIQHWLGVINLSVGYERKLGNRFAVQVEPYLKLPLAGVGAGNVKLASTGAFLTLKYRMSGRWSVAYNQ